MYDDQEIFSFELHETIYFERGQEVFEMIGISLDPVISIQSHDDYVSIKGMITLEGEYKKSEERREVGDVSTLKELETKRFIAQITEGGDGYSHFTHQFPIEISIPSCRVMDAEKIAVYV